MKRKRKQKKNIFFDESRFQWLEKEKREWLKNLSLKKSEKLQKSLLDFFDFHLINSIKDEPVSYKLLLLKAKK